jgi:hypothetical protein
MGCRKPFHAAIYRVAWNPNDSSRIRRSAGGVAQKRRLAERAGAQATTLITMADVRHHLLIAGTGRAGTSVLVRILTACAFDTELSRNGEGASWDQTASAGLESIPLLPGAHPYVVKSPWSYQYIRQLLDDPTTRLDGVLVPVRRLEDAAASRIVLEIQQAYRNLPALLDFEEMWTEWAAVSGGVIYSLQPLDVGRVLAHSFHRLIETLVEREIPIYFLAFPRFCTDLDYLRRALAPVLPAEIDEATFKERVAPVIELDKIRVADEIAGTKKREAVHEDLSILHEVALKREVKQLSAQLQAIAKNQAKEPPPPKEFQESTAQISQLQLEVTRLQAELSERTNDGERLRQKIDSIHASICWRLTWPIRWVQRVFFCKSLFRRK